MVFPDEAVKRFLCGVMRGEPMDWPAASDEEFYAGFLAHASYHGVEALIGHLLHSTAAWHALPGPLKEGLSLGMKRAAAMEMVRSRDLLELDARLNREHLSTLLLKGSALAYTHYPQPYLRSREDTDLFIAPAAIPRIKKVFLDMGYELHGQVYKSHQFKAQRSAFGGEMIKYDVHWRSSNRSLYARVISHEQAEQDAVPVPALGHCRTLSPKHALLQACLHRAGSTRHDPDRLIWLYDIHLLAQGLSAAELLDFAQTAVANDVQAICRDAINSSRQCFATAVPENILEPLQTTPRKGIWNRRFADSQLALIIDDLRVLPDARSRVELLREFLLPRGDYLLQRYRKENPYWIPLLYCRYLLGGLYERLTLR